MSKVFICYSHKDKEYLDLFLKHFDDDLLNVWSDTRIEGSEHWEEEIQKALESTNCGILILSANFFNSRFIKDIELQKLLQNQYERNTYLLPILAEECNIEKYDWLSKKEVLPKGFKALENIKKRNHNKEAVKIVKRVEKLLQKQPEQEKKDDLNNVNTVTVINYPENIAINNFPESNDDFFGREKYFDILDNAWGDEQVNILSFIAFGGIGKTSLIDNWLKKMKKDHYRGAKNIFMWSFYSQGSEEDRQITATEFLLEACKFFKIKKIPKTAYEQGRELADIISKQRALLVLDGLEPLQSSLEDIGEIKDNGLQVLLKRLSRQNKGLVVITSRIRLASIDNQYEELEKLEDYEGAELLKSFELNGNTKDLEQISRGFDGHALALKLLGSYTKVVLDGDINRIDEIESLRDDKSKSSKHATRMLNSYKKYLQREGKIELDILKLLGFFDRAISFEVINILKNKPLIENINDSLVEVSERDWKYALDNLKELHLISSSDKVLDTHPLVREYFSSYIEESFEDSYIEGHYRLYKYYEELPEKELPDTIEEMEPLFQAIYHGCKAKEYENVFWKIYNNRINRTVKVYLTNKLARFDLVVKLLSNFFIDKSYNYFYQNINERIRSSINGHLGYALYVIGKRDIALIKINQAIKLELESERYDFAVRNFDNVLNINLFLGQIKNIELEFEDYKLFLEKCENKDNEAIALSSYAYAVFLKGEFFKAEEIFKTVENLLLDEINSYKYMIPKGKTVPTNIYSVMGYRYYKLKFFKNEIKSIERKIENSLAVSVESNWTLDIGLDYISLGRLKQKEFNKKDTVLNIFNKAINYLRISNELNYLTEGLIFRADAFRYYKEFDKSLEDLEEAYDLIIHSEFKILLADWYIVAIKLALDEKDQQKANTYFWKAKVLSKELDEYFIFKEELKKLEPNFNKVI